MRLSTISGFLLLALPFASYPWGSDGHKMMARIAEDNLNSSVKDSLTYYLGAGDFADCSVWMDEIKRDSTYDFMFTWHYINIPDGQEYKPTDKPNIVNQLEAVIDRLKHREKYTKDQIAADIKILVHLMGDLHQPLHAGYAVDRGGNDIKVSFLGEESNLHKVWDVDIIEDQKMNLDSCYKWQANYLLKEEKTDIVKWMQESRSNLKLAYDAVNDNQIDKAYILKFKPLIEQRLMQSGLRLSNILNEVFS